MWWNEEPSERACGKLSMTIFRREPCRIPPRGREAVPWLGAGDALNVLLTDETAVRSLMEIVRPNDGAELAAQLRTFASAADKLSAAFPEHAAVCVREGYGTLVVKDEPPSVAFIIKEPRMVAAVEEYLRNLPDGAAAEDAQVAEALERYIKTL